MVETVKKGDFIEVEYTGKVSESGDIFDTTSEETAKKAGIPGDRKYEPVVVQL